MSTVEMEDVRMQTLITVVAKARCQQRTKWADPDLLVGPIGGRFVNETDTLMICESIKNHSGYENHIPLLVVSQDGLLYVAGGSHRMQAVTGVIPVAHVPYQEIDLSHISGLAQTMISMERDGALVVAAVEATDPRSKTYSPLQDCLLIGDILRSFQRQYRTVQQLVGNRKVCTQISPGEILNFYNEIAPGYLLTIERQKNKSAKVRILSALLKLFQVGEDRLRNLIQLEDRSYVTVTDRQVITLAPWDKEEVEKIVDLMIERFSARIGGAVELHREDRPIPVFTLKTYFEMCKSNVMTVEEEKVGRDGTVGTVDVTDMKSIHSDLNTGNSENECKHGQTEVQDNRVVTTAKVCLGKRSTRKANLGLDVSSRIGFKDITKNVRLQKKRLLPGWNVYNEPKRDHLNYRIRRDHLRCPITRMGF